MNTEFELFRLPIGVIEDWCSLGILLGNKEFQDTISSNINSKSKADKCNNRSFEFDPFSVFQLLALRTGVHQGFYWEIWSEHVHKGFYWEIRSIGHYKKQT